MKQLTLKNSNHTLACRIGDTKDSWFRSDVPCEYEPDVAAYAAARYILHCPRLRDQLVPQAVRLGLRSGRAAKPIRRRVKTRASALSLPGGTAWIYLTITQGQILIQGVRVAADRVAR